MHAILKAPMCAAFVLILANMSSSAYAARNPVDPVDQSGGTAQCYTCNSRGTAEFRSITSKEKNFDYGDTNKVATLVSLGGKADPDGFVGVEIVPTPQEFKSIEWYFKGDNFAPFGTNVNYCFTTKAGKHIEISLVADVRKNSTITTQKDGWKLLQQHNDAFPTEAVGATLDRIVFRFIQRLNPANITLGKVILNGKDAVSTLLMDNGQCASLQRCNPQP